MSELTIPKVMHTVWVGPRPMPAAWIDTWKQHHPEWEHIMWDITSIQGRTWRNQKALEHYLATEQWPGVADIVRAEVLFNIGGFMPGADSVCLRPIDELFEDNMYEAYASFENEIARGKLLTPLLACAQHSVWAHLVIKGIGMLTEYGEPWETTGNKLMTHIAEVHDFDGLKIWPSHYFIPDHYTGETYTGPEKPYARHMWGSTTKSYPS